MKSCECLSRTENNSFPENETARFKNVNNRTARIRHQCRKTTALGCHRYINNIGVEKNEQHIKIDLGFDHQWPVL
jgi:hypothetical protein